MRKRTIVAAVLVLGFGIFLIWGLSKYKLVLIQSIVENAVVQKAPSGYSETRIRQAFKEHFAHAWSSERENIYLDRLLQASQRLEKVQTLKASQVDQLLEDLDPTRRQRR
ncbi:MAG: hypothetical protein EHM61_05775 [Acidobacteria bacterium]|nr:MAG: hypothetical protein EHM61_05775 [Acidobacteriota bacterium]